MSRRRACLAFTCLCFTILSTSHVDAQEIDVAGARADSGAVVTLDPLLVEGRIEDLSGEAISASEGRTGRVDLSHRPLLREGELLETVPGMILTQHSGDGKSNQMFVRGFNLDHGTDFRSIVEGMPVNLPTHAHGQGYTDLNFLVPELVERIDYRLGVYYPELGDFGSAGEAEVHFVRSLPTPFALVEVGELGLIRTVAGGSLDLGGGELLAGGELKAYDGPWTVPQDLRKASGLLRWTRRTGPDELSLLALGYVNSWDASDQIPRRAVEEGFIDRFGQVDETLGGNSKRFSLSASWTRFGSGWTHRLDAYAIRHELDLWSDFTYFLDDPVNGDQFEQRDRRWSLGAQFDGRRQLGRHALLLGAETRLDRIGDVGLYNTVARERTGTIRSDRVNEWGSGAWLAAESRWNSWVRTTVGLRGDLYYFDVSSNIPENSGSRWAGLASPRLSAAFGPWAGVEYYASAGFAFHSNDARGTVISVDPVTHEPVDRVDPLVRSRGAELGLRASPTETWRTTLAGWILELDSELLFVGDAGTTEPSDRSHRIGVTWTNFWRPIPRLSIDADISVTRARFVGPPAGEDYIPGAVESVIAAGITWDSHGGGPLASLRVRHLGAYPLIEDDSIRSGATTLVNARVGWHFGRIQLYASVLNLFDVEQSDIEYWYASRGPNEPIEGVEDVHFHPVEPRQLRAGVAWGL